MGRRCARPLSGCARAATPTRHTETNQSTANRRTGSRVVRPRRAHAGVMSLPPSPPIPGSAPGLLDGDGSADHDQPYRFGHRPRTSAPYPFNPRQYAPRTVRGFTPSRLPSPLRRDGRLRGRRRSFQVAACPQRDRGKGSGCGPPFPIRGQCYRHPRPSQGRHCSLLSNQLGSIQQAAR
jgi:hypothetical protein